MPSYQLHALLLRLGLALGAGLLIALVPIFFRKARWEAHLPRRIVFSVLTLVSLVGFCVYAWHLWNRFVPREPAPPDPISFPAPPSVP